MNEPAPPPPPGELSLVEDLLARCLECAPGERAAELERLCEEHPEEADELRRRHAVLAAIGLDLSLADDDRPDFPESLGDFRLIEPLGGGGMGVVYRAEQVSLGREVALKLVRPEQLFFPSARERFRREVTAIARLQHTNIVPVYTVGEEDGIPYFAMELVQGCTLGRAIADLADRSPESLTGADLARVVAERAGGAGTEPATGSSERETIATPGIGAPLPDTFAGSWTDACLRIVRQIADALAHAHARGIVHRDVKPSNIALRPDGRALLLDFGLTSSTGGDRMTRTGGTVGTPAYMSPEQVRGADVDVRTDVYSLGVTLYELLTLRAPWRADSESGIKALILDGRPTPLRAANGRIAPDVQTVCLHAMDREASVRYADAPAFARDIDHLLEKRPIEARPPGPGLRLRRWTQRNPALAASLVLGVALVGGLPTALLIQAKSHGLELAEKADRLASQAATLEQQSNELRESNVALASQADMLERQSFELRDTNEELLVQRNIAQAELRTSQEALSFILRMLGRSMPHISRGDPPTVADMLEEATAELATALHDEPLIRARLLFEIGAMHSLSERYTTALPLLDEGIALLEQQPDDPLVIDWRAQALHHRGHSRLRLGDMTGAEVDLLDVLDHLADQPEFMLVSTRNELAEVYQETGRIAEAEALIRRNVEVVDAWEDASPEDEWGVRNNLATLLYESGRLQEAFAIQVEVARDARATMPWPDPMLASTLANLGQMLLRAGGIDEAEPMLLEALAMRRRLWPEDSPDVASSLRWYGNLLDAQGEVERARAVYAETARMYAEVYPHGHRVLTSALTDYKANLSAHGQWELFADLLPALIASQRAEFQQPSPQLGEALGQRAYVLLRAGRLDEAVCHFEDSARQFAGSPYAQHRIASLNEAAKLRFGFREYGEASTLLHRAARDLLDSGMADSYTADNTRQGLRDVAEALGKPVAEGSAAAMLLAGAGSP